MRANGPHSFFTVIRGVVVTIIIDRRKNRGKNDSNRHRFLRRYHQIITEAVKGAVNARSIQNATSKGINIRVRRDRLAEASFNLDYSTGIRQGVNFGNTKYAQGDLILRPEEVDGQYAKSASSDGEDSDDFIFTISSEEFQKYFFDELELPNMTNQSLNTNEVFKYVRTGFATVGNPANLDLVRSVRNSLSREIAFDDENCNVEEILLLSQEYNFLISVIDRTVEQQNRLDEIKKLLNELQQIGVDSSNSFSMDQMDLRYRSFSKQVVPNSKAVMFCILDVSGSMGQTEKDLAKRFFILLYLFLQREYEKIEVRFVRHHTIAEEVDEERFFYDRITGGTIVSTAMYEIERIIQKDYSDGMWNIYGAQASDGDNEHDDIPVLRDKLVSSILPTMQYYAYVEITSSQWRQAGTSPSSNMWNLYNEICEFIPWLATAHVNSATDIYPVFARLFKKS